MVFVAGSMPGRDSRIQQRSASHPADLCSVWLGMGRVQVHLVEIDTEEDPEIAEAAGINGTPTVQLFKNRERLHHLPGVKQKREYKSLIEASL